MKEKIEFKDILPYLSRRCAGKHFLFIDEVPLAKMDKVSKFSFSGNIFPVVSKSSEFTQKDLLASKLQFDVSIFLNLLYDLKY